MNCLLKLLIVVFSKSNNRNHFFEKLEPRFKKISHKVKDGETLFVDVVDNKIDISVG